MFTHKSHEQCFSSDTRNDDDDEEEEEEKVKKVCEGQGGE